MSIVSFDNFDNAQNSIVRGDLSFTNGHGDYIACQAGQGEKRELKLSELITSIKGVLSLTEQRLALAFCDPQGGQDHLGVKGRHLYPVKNIDAINAVIEEKNQRIDRSLIYSILNIALRFFTLNFLSLKYTPIVWFNPHYLSNREITFTNSDGKYITYKAHGRTQKIDLNKLVSLIKKRMDQGAQCWDASNSFTAVNWAYVARNIYTINKIIDEKNNSLFRTIFSCMKYKKSEVAFFIDTTWGISSILEQAFESINQDKLGQFLNSGNSDKKYLEDYLTLYSKRRSSKLETANLEEDYAWPPRSRLGEHGNLTLFYGSGSEIDRAYDTSKFISHFPFFANEECSNKQCL